MADTSSSITLTPDAQGNVQLSIPGLPSLPDGSLVGYTITKTNDGQSVTVQVAPPLGPENLVFWALVLPLVLGSIFGLVVTVSMLWGKENLGKTLDKLAQLLSESDAGSSKMSLSRVQALIFTYVIAFGCLLIIARTGQFPTAIPDDLAILAGGSLATYVAAKAIQTQGTNAK